VITYYKYHGTEIRMSQKYDEKNPAWSAVTYYESERVGI